MEKHIITISRQYGSGGRMAAEKLAEQLGWKFYDRALIEKIAEKSGLAKEFIEEKGLEVPAGSDR